MKILIVCDVLGDENNGTTVASTNLIKYLRSQGDEVRILCADQNRKDHKDTYVVPTIYLGLLINHLLKKNNVELAKPNKKIIKKALEGVDIVHVMMPFALGNKTAKIARKMGIPVTAGFHAPAESFSAHIFNTMRKDWFNKIVYKVFYKNLYSRVNAIHYPTENIKNIFENVIRVKTNGVVISNGVDSSFKKKEVTRSEKLSKKFNVLFIGRISKEKSHDILVKAIALSKHKDDIQLVFAGQGPRQNNIQKLARKLKLNEPLINFYSHEKLLDVINQCDLYVHPSEVETEGIACLEAVSCGLVPVISNSHKCATKAYALDEKSLFQYDSPQDLANKIDYWFEHREEKEEYSKKYQNSDAIISQDKCLEKTRNMFLTYSKPINHTKLKTYYYRDEVNDDFANMGINVKKTKANHKYIHKCPIWNVFQFILYFIIAKPLVYLINKVVYRQKFVNHLTCKKSEIPGCFIYANHTLDMGDAYTPNVVFARRNSIIVNPAATSIFGIKTVVEMLGGLPLPSTLKGTVNFVDSLKHKVNKGQSITIYPEAHIWPYYTGIRNFPDGSFKYPVEFNKPIIVITNTFLAKGKSNRLVTHIDGPFYPDINLDKKEATQKLRELAFSTMKRRSLECPQIELRRYIDLNKIEVQ